MLIRDATLADGRVRDVRVREGRIHTVGRNLPVDGELVPADEKLLLPGMIDVHTHFREPGDSHKETWSTGSRSAAAGGVTTVVDQPNTEPPTVSGTAFDAKAERAAASLVDYGLNGGVTPDWEPDSLFARPLFALGEVFLADSTGDMGIDEELFADAVATAAAHDLPVTVHAEDADLFDESARERSDPDAWSAYRTAEAELAAVEAAAELARAADTRLHIAHASTPEAVDAAGPMSCEATAHHLFLSREDYDDLGTFGRMNPPLRSERRREALFERLVDGRIDIVASDHAPHTREEKAADVWDAPSGVPGVETTLPLLLEAARNDRIGLERVRDVTARRPAEIFGLQRKGRIEEGYDADLVLVDPQASREIRAEKLHTSCEWTPFEGRRGVFPEWTMRRGEFVYRREDDEETFADGGGRNVRADG
jgi:dihydroorotase